MIITLLLNSFLYELFPTESNNIEQLKSSLKAHYTLGPFEPKIEISENEIIITVDSNKYLEDKDEYQKLISLCEIGKYNKAKPLVEQHIKKSPNKENYSIPAIKDKTFTRYQTLAYYYTS
jgi:hypothetical protein